MQTHCTACPPFAAPPVTTSNVETETLKPSGSRHGSRGRVSSGVRVPATLDAESVGTLAQGQSAMPLPPWLLLFVAVLPTHFVAGLDNGECDVDRGCRRALPASA